MVGVQPTINMGLVGHVDHGKTSLTKLLSGKWTDTHSEERKRGITIKLGYTNFIIYNDGNVYNVKKRGDAIRKISIVDAPGHESFMATMISGAAVMDCAILVIAANEKCPQPQTIEHLKTLEIAGVKDVIIVQNKIDLVKKEEAIKNYEDICEFIKGTIAENAPIIPMSAQYGTNLDVLLKYIVEYFKEPKRDLNKEPLMHIIRSFDINKPGDDFEDLKGGVLGGSIIQGRFKVGDEIEIKPGIMLNKDGKTIYKTIETTINGLMSDRDKLEEAIPGGSVAIMTSLDPTVTKTDSLVGQMVGLKGKLPEPKIKITFQQKLFEKVITTKGKLPVKDFIPNEPLMLIVNSLTTVGIIEKTNPKKTTVFLKRPVMAFKDDRVVIFKRFDNNKWRIIGYGIIED